MPKISVIIRVKPGSKKGAFVQPSMDGELLVSVREPAVEGRANIAVIAAVAEYYNVAKSRVCITRGHTSRIKQLSIYLDT